ncbi:nucleotidyltransferase family protein [Pseudothermotoga thermarum]|uniref:nucleotidyltransferase family protein n=1 Tax=Pseudothermotoga thermarum TaxID=119394 RepID=UPI00030E729A
MCRLKTNKYKVAKIGIFGSFARGERKNRSDVDLLVEFEEVPNLLEVISLEMYLRSPLGR